MSYLKFPLRLLSWIYLILTEIRNKLYDYKILKSYKSELPVICVGNVTVGGNGKTPLVINIANSLKNNQLRPVILSRGYGGSDEGPYRLEEADDPNKVGDEPVLIKELTGVDVVISRDRAKGAKFIEAQNIGDVILMDDGYQHRRLDRDLNILCFDVSTKQAVDRVGSGNLLPLGRLRERLSRAVKRADLVVLNSRSIKNVCEYCQEIQKLLPSDLKVFTTKLKVNRLLAIDSRSCLTNSSGVVLLSAIANPEGFKSTVEEMGYEVIANYFFKDHHKFTVSEIKEIFESHPETPIVCSEKDAVKLKILNIDLDNVYVLNVSIDYLGDVPNWAKMLN